MLRRKSRKRLVRAGPRPRLERLLFFFVTYYPFVKKHAFHRVGAFQYDISEHTNLIVYILTCLRISLSSLTVISLSLTLRECRALLLPLTPLSSQLLLPQLLFCAGLLLQPR